MKDMYQICHCSAGYIIRGCFLGSVGHIEKISHFCTHLLMIFLLFWGLDGPIRKNLLFLPLVLQQKGGTDSNFFCIDPQRV